MTLEIVIEDASLVKKVKLLLEEVKILNKNEKIVKKNGSFIIFTTVDDIALIPTSIKQLELTIRQNDLELDDGKNNVVRFVSAKLKELGVQNDVLLNKLPKKYTIYQPMLLINSQDTFDSIEWTEFFNNHDKDEFFDQFLKIIGNNITHIAVNKPIVETDVMRRPFSLLPIYGDFGPEPTQEMFDNPTEEDFKNAFWCKVNQNGIIQNWAPRYTMFSRGNIKEKKRILDEFKDVENKTVVDLYAGIGYFTLSYLKLKAKHLFCFELNPWSIEGLIRGVKDNGYSYKLVKHGQDFQFDESIKVFIFHESNEYAIERLTMKLPINHINLGLLPTSKPSWLIAETLFLTNSNSNVCSIHIHENVHIDEIPQFMDKTSVELLQISPDESLMVEPLKLNKIKTFAPDVWHISADFNLIK